MTLDSQDNSSFAAAWRTGYRQMPVEWLILGSAGVVSVFVGIQIAIWRINGLWWDEVFSLWASDPSRSFRDNFFLRIAPDTVPPAYYSLLYVARLFVRDGRTAALVLNCVVLALAAIIVVFSARRARLVPVALLSIGAFLLSGPVIYYTSEARPYLAAFALTFVLSWRVCLQLTQQDTQQAWFGFAALGIAAALIHLYAALVCCCFAAGLIAVALKYPGRRALIQNAIVLGLSSGVTACLWLYTVRNSFGRVAWIRFNLSALLDAMKSVFYLNGGLAFLAIFLAIACLPRNCQVKINERRSLTLAFSVAYLLFFAIPILISFKKPVIVDHYWLVGSPGVIVFVLFQLRKLYPNLIGGEPTSGCRRTQYICATLAVVWALIGIDRGYARFDDKPVWRGVAEVRPLIASCPTHSVAVAIGVTRENKKFQVLFHYDSSFFFGTLTEKPADTFISVEGENDRGLVARDSKCPVLGWAEQLRPATLNNMSDTDLLNLLDIEASNGEVTIRRHKTGFVVLRR